MAWEADQPRGGEVVEVHRQRGGGGGLAEAGAEGRWSCAGDGLAEAAARFVAEKVATFVSLGFVRACVHGDALMRAGKNRWQGYFGPST
jgi:hypothetical protein